MAPYEFLSITTSDTLPATYGHALTDQLPMLEETVPPRLVFEIGTLSNGLEYSIQLLKAGDFKAVQQLTRAANEKEPGNLIDRSDEEVIDILTNNHVVALAVNGRLAGIGVVDLIDDEKDEGRGRPVQGYDLDEKTYFKMGVTHPAMQGLGVIKKIYPYRLAIATSYEERLVMVTKTINPDVGDACLKNKWTLEQQDKIFVEQGGMMVEKVLDTYVLKREKGVKWLKDNRKDIFDRLPPRHDNTPVSTIEALTL